MKIKQFKHVGGKRNLKGEFRGLRPLKKKKKTHPQWPLKAHLPPLLNAHYELYCSYLKGIQTLSYMLTYMWKILHTLKSFPRQTTVCEWNVFSQA